DGTAETLHRALTMEPAEIERRMTALRKRGQANDVARWVSNFRAVLGGARRLAQPAADGGATWRALLAERFHRAGRALLLLDYDGTLIDIVDRPDAAAPTPPVRTLLQRLGAAADTVVISGRDTETLQRWLGDLPLHLVAEHGFWLRRRGANVWEE